MTKRLNKKLQLIRPSAGAPAIKGISTKPLLVALLTLAFISVLGYWLFGVSKAATSGTMTMWLHKERSAANETYNALTLTDSELSANTASGTTSTTVTNATPPTNFCQSSNNTGDTFTQVSASAAAVGNYCIGTFISMPVGQAITMSTSDAASIAAGIWSSESASQVTAALNIYIYRWTGTGTSVVSTDRIATLTCADPGTSATSCAPTAVAPANNITFVATDRIIAIVTINVTASRSGASVSAYFDSSSAASWIRMHYTPSTPNKPTLTGPLDDDFASINTVANLSCPTNGSTTYGNWICLGGTATNSTVVIDANDSTGSGSGAESSWMKITNKFTAAGTASNFGTTPSNGYLYQNLPSAYGSGTVRTVVNSPVTYAVAANSPASPYNHAGLLLWSSNTDYLEVQVYSTAATGGTNTVNVALNNSGTISGATSLNPTTTTGTYNRVWLGFSNTNGSWQAQYSTDGSTWNNIGSTVSHSVFSRVGLNVYDAIGAAAGTYSASFDWFQSTLATPTYNQISYRWFANADSTTPGSPFTIQNTPYVLTSTGQQFRLRALLSMQGQTAVNGQSFNLQYAGMGGYTSCSAIPSANYANVTGNAGWTQATAAAAWTARSSFEFPPASAAFNNKLWLLGGNTGTDTNEVWSSPDGVTWTQQAAPGWSARSGLGAVVFNNKLWVMGGNTGLSTDHNDVWYTSDGTTWTQATAAAGWSARDNFALVVFNSKMWIMGGESAAAVYNNEVWSSSDGITWTQQAAPGWSARFGLNATVYNSKIWIMGGHSSTGDDHDVWSTSDGTTWTQATAAAGWSARLELGLTVFNNQMWLMGGTSTSGTANNEVWTSSDGITWTQQTNASWGVRGDLSVQLMNSYIWVYGGDQNGTTTYHDVWYYSTGGSGGIGFYNNPTPASGASIATTANDPTDGAQTVNPQTYQEANSFTNSQSTYGGTADAEWDFALYDNGAPSGTTYCFRIAKSDGTPLDTYTNYPMITTAPTIDQFMRGGMWFSRNGSKQGYYWAQ